MTKEHHVFFIMGTTCSGKTSFIEDRYLTGYFPRWECVNVGKEMRERHPPDFFEGKASMEKTEEEARGIFIHQLSDFEKVNFIDGMPRTTKQVQFCLATTFPALTHFCLFKCHDVELERRAKNRFADDPASLDLAMKRIHNDKITYYHVLSELHRLNIPVKVFDTSGEFDSYRYEVLNWMAQQMRGSS